MAYKEEDKFIVLNTEKLLELLDKHGVEIKKGVFDTVEGEGDRMKDGKIHAKSEDWNGETLCGKQDVTSPFVDKLTCPKCIEKTMEWIEKRKKQREGELSILEEHLALLKMKEGA